MLLAGKSLKSTFNADPGLINKSRNAVDFGLPLLNDAKTAQLFVESLAKKIPQGGLRGYQEGRIPSEVRSWREFVGHRA